MNARRIVAPGSNGSGTSVVRLVVAAVLVAVALTSLIGSVSPVGAERISKKGNQAAIPPDGCPPGFEQATYPLNPALGCLPVNIADAEGGEPVKIVGTTVECPEGTVPATPPLNPQLGCVSNTFTAEVEVELFHPNHCPDGWKPAESPLNPALKCVPDRIVAKS